MMTRKAARRAIAALVVITAGTGCGGSDEPEVPEVPEPTPDAGPEPQPAVVRIAAGDLSASTTWRAGTTYVLDGLVFVTSGTLTIEPGVIVRAEAGSALVITKDARLHAVGRADAPIVFTSAQAAPAPGDWYGVALLGRAEIGVAGGTNAIEGYHISLGERLRYGGGADPRDDHDCGKLVYARIEYSGGSSAPQNEQPGLILGACGTATVIDFVQVHRGADDGIRVYGGTVPLRHVVVSQPDGDGLQLDLSWRGDGQFVIVQQRPDRGDKAIDLRTQPAVSPEIQPASRIWNYTLIGGGPTASYWQTGASFQGRAAPTFGNGVVAFFNDAPVRVDESAADPWRSRAAWMRHTFFYPWPSSGSSLDPFPDTFDERVEIGGDPTNRLDIDPKLAAPQDLDAPRFGPAVGSPVLAGCGTPPAGFDTTATFCGAIGGTDWTTGWTRFGD